MYERNVWNMKPNWNKLINPKFIRRIIRCQPASQFAHSLFPCVCTLVSNKSPFLLLLHLFRLFSIDGYSLNCYFFRSMRSIYKYMIFLVFFCFFFFFFVFIFKNQFHCNPCSWFVIAVQLSWQLLWNKMSTVLVTLYILGPKITIYFAFFLKQKKKQKRFFLFLLRNTWVSSIL